MIIFILIILCLAAAAAALAFFLTSSAIIFAKGAFALCVAGILSSNSITLVPNNNFLNFVAWAVISFGIVYMFSILPRAEVAIRFLSTATITLVIIFIGSYLFGSIFVKGFEMSWIFEAIIKIICLAIAVVIIGMQRKKFNSESSSKFVVRIIDRAIASVFYSFALTLLTVSFENNWNISETFVVVLLIVYAVVAFIADIFFADKVIFGREASKEIVMPQ